MPDPSPAQLAAALAIDVSSLRKEIISDINVIGCIYRTVGDTMYDEPRERLADRIIASITPILKQARAERDAAKEGARRWDRCIEIIGRVKAAIPSDGETRPGGDRLIETVLNMVDRAKAAEAERDAERQRKDDAIRAAELFEYEMKSALHGQTIYPDEARAALARAKGESNV